MQDEKFLEKKEESISINIFSVSAAMVGVCLTVLSLFSIRKGLRGIETLAEELVSFNSFLFLISCVISYIGIKTQERKRRYKIEKLADTIFITALSLMVVISLLVVLEFA